MQGDLRRSLITRRRDSLVPNDRGHSLHDSLLTRTRFSAPSPSHAVAPSFFLHRQLQWQSSEQTQVMTSFVALNGQLVQKIQPVQPVKQTETKSKISKTLNDLVFNLKSSVQSRLYWMNFFTNFLLRFAFVNLLVFLFMQNKQLYLQIFLSLEMTVIVLYYIVMVKMLFTKSDKESVYFQKIFNQRDWVDIQQERIMRRHFSITRIVTKISTFFNPCSKFQSDIKILFLKQEIYKRMEIMLVEIPFAFMFFLRPSDFLSENKQYFNVWINLGICVQILRATINYLLVYIYS